MKIIIDFHISKYFRHYLPSSVSSITTGGDQSPDGVSIMFCINSLQLNKYFNQSYKKLHALLRLSCNKCYAFVQTSPIIALYLVLLKLICSWRYVLYIQSTCTIYKSNSFSLRRKLLNKILTYTITSCLRVEASLLFSSKCSTYSSVNNLTKVRILFTLKHRRSDNSLSLILFSDTYIDPSNGDFHLTNFRF